MRPLLALALCGCASAPPATAENNPRKPTADDAKAFVARVNEDLKRLFVKSSTADWIKNTYITDDTERNAASANEELLGYQARATKTAAAFKELPLDPDTGRMLYLLRISATAPAPEDAKKRLELTTLAAKLEGHYGSAKDKKGRDLQELSALLRKSRNHDELLDAWVGWHETAREQRPRYQRFVELANEGAREIGFANMGDVWRSSYDIPPDEFEKETDRLWAQVKPLYDGLHCYVRAQLQQQYGKERIPEGKPIPAHVLGNMWAQEWGSIYPLVEPYKGVASLDVTKAIVAQKWDPVRMVKAGEAFFTSMGLDPLPRTFWERSMLVKPRDREVVCHASAWDVQFDDDLRIKMCIRPEEEDLVTIHHELGHDYYFHAYYKLPALYQGGANDGFHEAIGDALTLAMTPAYLKRLGLLEEMPDNPKAVINVQMKDALNKVAFLPFGKLIDQWRWDVFNGKTAPGDYNKAWWALRTKFQGIAAPVARSEQDFDPGAKYHVPANVPYTRYFLARILQFQFYRAMCQAAGHKGPLHQCSFYGSKEAGARLWKMLSMGASRPWPDALEAMTGQRQMDGGALLEYFAPLQAWLLEQNKGLSCGW